MNITSNASESDGYAGYETTLVCRETAPCIVFVNVFTRCVYVCTHVCHYVSNVVFVDSTSF